MLWLVQWVDDDRFTLLAGDTAPVGDLLMCRISSDRCDTVIERSTWATPPLLPGAGGVGAELAMERATETVLEAREGR